MIKQVFLTACLIFITASFLLLWDSPPESFLSPDPNKVENLPIADSYMSETKSIIFSENGYKKYSVKAEEIAIFSGFSELKFSQPKLIAYKQNSKQTNYVIKSGTGTLNKNSEIFEFQTSITANWINSGGTTALRADSLSYSFKENSASAKGGVQLTSGNSKLSGDALSANFESQIFRLKSHVKSVYEAI